MEFTLSEDQLKREQYAAAIHEAGHAVAACAVGFGMKKKGIVLRNSFAEGLWDGVAYTRRTGRCGSNAKKRELFHKNRIVVSLAGPIAEHMVNTQLYHIDGDVQNIAYSLRQLLPAKRQFLRKFLAEVPTSNWSEFWSLVFCLAVGMDWQYAAEDFDEAEGIYADLTDTFAHLVEVLCPLAQQAHDIINGQWTIVKRISSQLLKGGSLGGEDIEAIVANPSYRPRSRTPLATDCHPSQRGEHMELNTAKDIRTTVTACFPDVNDDEDSIQRSGFAHDHPLIAISVVLISSIVLGTTDPVKLAQFTGYSESFVRGIAINMENSGLWNDGKYDYSSWFSGDLVPRKEPEQWAFWQHVMIAEGSLMEPGSDEKLVQHTCSVFWNDMLDEAKALGVMMWRKGKRIM